MVCSSSEIDLTLVVRLTGFSIASPVVSVPRLPTGVDVPPVAAAPVSIRHVVVAVRRRPTPGGSVHGERANFTGLVLGYIDADFASKYALESSRRDLHNAILCIAF